MAYALDPEIEAVLLAAAQGSSAPPPPARGDWRQLRENADTMMAAMAQGVPLPEGVEVERFETRASDGAPIEMRWYRKAGAAPGSAILYLHGGGMICGSLDIYDCVVAGYVAETGVPMLAVEYRLAPEHPHPVPVEDCYTGLAWLFDNAARLGVDPARIAVMGDSAGGGLAAGVGLLARDRGVALARQILIYPMLDDRVTTGNPEMLPFATWTYDNNWTGWHALIGDRIGTDQAPHIAAPARAEDLTGMAPLYMEVGDLDIFRTEDIAYALRAAECGIPLELHVHPGAPHGFERTAVDAQVSRRAMADRYRVIQSV